MATANNFAFIRPGYNWTYIVRKANVSPYYIKRVLCAAGKTVIFRESDQKRYGALRPVVLELFKQNWSLRAIQQQAKTSMVWVEKIIKDAGFTPPPKTLPGHRPLFMNYVAAATSSPQECADQNNHVSITTMEQDTAVSIWAISEYPKQKDLSLQSQHDPVATVSHSASELFASNSVFPDDRQRGYLSDTPENAESGQENNGIAESTTEDRNAPSNHMELDIPEVSVELIESAEQFLPGCKIRQEEYNTLPDAYLENVSEMPLLHPQNSTSGRRGRYQCQICCLSWGEDEAFLSHLADREHEQLSANGIFLHCTGCRFRSRKPETMGKHIIKYQSQSLLENCIMHSVIAIR
ncbi:uncharacterized protein LOC129592323 [Paramacrobiotus metropolitanus]|uniref:uncharacterized protein LOC129592323 n=1 Tax=Paramacrobiotus metropolitanus TaxID=2943436 RepID=UPI0024464036|nr:uncharacterized protein LOC129592323 [Paramacrobiotus metropolitanus]